MLATVEATVVADEATILIEALHKVKSFNLWTVVNSSHATVRSTALSPYAGRTCLAGSTSRIRRVNEMMCLRGTPTFRLCKTKETSLVNLEKEATKVARAAMLPEEPPSCNVKESRYQMMKRYTCEDVKMTLSRSKRRNDKVKR